MDMIVDMQFGSTGKGLLAGYLALKKQPELVITAWGPNAGHTFIDHDGRKYVHTMLANGIVSPALKYVMIGPGSVINVNALLAECAAANFPLNKLVIHSAAALVTESHRAEESEYGFKIGSTMKGTAAAMVQKLRRDPDCPNTAGLVMDEFAAELLPCVVTQQRWEEIIMAHDTAMVEGAQGYSLSLNKGFYPYTTSRDCTPQQLLVDCGLPWPYWHLNIIGVARTYPIRVANRFDAVGNQIGTSGPCYPDQREMDWEEIQRGPELTTVTKLPRRIFTWSGLQIRDAVYQCGIKQVFLNFCNYLSNQEQLNERMSAVEEAGATVKWTGWGASVDCVREE
jgi:adenylosuccinate synthase